MFYKREDDRNIGKLLNKAKGFLEARGFTLLDHEDPLRRHFVPVLQKIKGLQGFLIEHHDFCADDKVLSLFCHARNRESRCLDSNWKIACFYPEKDWRKKGLDGQGREPMVALLNEFVKDMSFPGVSLEEALGEKPCEPQRQAVKRVGKIEAHL